MSLPPPAPKIKPSDLRRSHPDKKNQLQSPAAILPLSRCSSTPSPAPVQKSTTISMTGRRGSSTPKSPSCTSEMHVERSSSCLFGRSNPFDTDFCVKELVGEGGFGKIYKCKSNIDGRWYAVKLEEFWFKPQAYFNPSEVREVMMNEALALARLDHENVCRYYNTWVFGSLVSIDTPKQQSNKDDQSEFRGKHNSPRRPTCESVVMDDMDVSDGDDNFVDDYADFSDLGFDFEADDAVAECQQSTTTPMTKSTSPRTTEHLSPPGTRPETTSASPLGRRRRNSSLSLDSPNTAAGLLCTKIDVYIQMALYDGASLQQWMEQRKCVKIDESLRIFRQLVAGLRYIHSQGLIHRDIKPANVFLTEHSCVKIGDFGLAKNTLESSLHIDPSQYYHDEGNDFDDGYGNCTLQTGFGPHTLSTGVGTPLYSSPEQISGAPYDASTDVYSLGIVLCELFCVFSTQMERHIVLSNAREGRVPAKLERDYPDIAHMIRLMVASDKTARPTCAEIEASDLMCTVTKKSPRLQQKFDSRTWKPVTSPRDSISDGSSVGGEVMGSSAVDSLRAILLEMNRLEQHQRTITQLLQDESASVTARSITHDGFQDDISRGDDARTAFAELQTVSLRRQELTAAAFKLLDYMAEEQEYA